MKDIIMDPDEFYSEQQSNFTSYRSVAIVVLAGLTSTISPLILLYYQSRIDPDEAALLITTAGIITVIGSFASVFASWFISSGIMHVLANRTKSSRGDFRKLFIFSGFGFIANVFGEGNKSLATFLTLRNLFTNNSATELGSGTIAVTVTNSTAMTMTVVVTILVLLWRWVIWTFAVKHTYGLELTDSIKIAAVPSVITILFTVLISNAQLLGM